MHGVSSTRWVVISAIAMLGALTVGRGWCADVDLTDLRKLPDAAFEAQFLEKISASQGFRFDGFERWLLELEGRNSAEMRKNLKSWIEMWDETEVVRYPDGALHKKVSAALFNFEALTVLRRMEGREGPLRLTAEIAAPQDGPPEWQITSNVKIPVRIENIDPEKHAVGFTFGGNYRSGRPDRYRIEMIDVESGMALPLILHHGVMGGGIFTEGLLEAGESWETELSLRSFVSEMKPGRYRLRIMYHNRETIACEEAVTVADRICVASKPVEVVIKPLEIKVSAARIPEIENAISALGEEEPLIVIAGPYSATHHNLVSPRSPAGKLMTIGLPAVPALIESLDDPESPPQKRAWVFSILHSITGAHDPRKVPSVLGDHEFSGDGGTWFKKDGEFSGGGAGLGGSHQGGPIDVEAQTKLAQAWREWLAKVKVERGA